MIRSRVVLLGLAALVVSMAGLPTACQAESYGAAATVTEASDEATASKILQAELEHLRSQLASSTGQLSTLQPAHEALQAELSAGKVAQTEMQAKLRALEVSHTELQGVCDMRDASNRELQARNGELEAQVTIARNSAEQEVAQLKKRVAELEEAWLPMWLELAVEDVQEKSQTAIDATSQKSRELYTQGTAITKDYYEKACELTIVSDMQKHTAHYSQVGIAKAKEGLFYAKEAWDSAEAKLEPLVVEASSHATRIHTELCQFIQHKMSDTATLRSYSDPSTVSMLVTAMMVSPFVALAAPLFLWILSCCCGAKPSRPKSPSRAAPPPGGTSGLASSSAKKKRANDPKSPVQYGQVGEVSVGGERVKYGKPVKM